MAKNLCESKGLEFTYKHYGIDFSRNEMLDTFPAARTFPQIIVNEEKIGGYDNLKALLECQPQ
jgi:glutaredoxin